MKHIYIIAVLLSFVCNGQEIVIKPGQADDEMYIDMDNITLERKFEKGDKSV